MQPRHNIERVILGYKSGYKRKERMFLDGQKLVLFAHVSAVEIVAGPPAAIQSGLLEEIARWRPDNSGAKPTVMPSPPV
ncbi:unnamed protein product [Peronospora belbahrii]|uniref:Uncharacterized protein n=1 Tax=Peronospora belbahrii TaxID=622444 RepID=A0AAU9LBZ1_9STRA|nr:unnamed protein product [Peronospora belbahrii]